MTEPDLKLLVDRQQIEQVLIAYCTTLDRMDLDALSALFTDDCEVDFGRNAALRSHGREALSKSLERMWRWTRTSHHLSNVSITFEGTAEARATSYVFAWHERSDGTSATIMGQYLDRLVRSGNRWLISERRMVMNGSDAGFTVPIHAFERHPPPPGWTAPDVGEST